MLTPDSALAESLHERMTSRDAWTVGIESDTEQPDYQKVWMVGQALCWIILGDCLSITGAVLVDD